MTDERPSRELSLAAALASAMSHPVQGRILMILEETGPSSAGEVAAEMSEGPVKIRYHLRQLAKHGLVDLTETKARRGVIEHFYRPVRAPFIDDDVFANLTSAQKMRTAVYVFKAVFADTSRALQAGTLEGRPDHLSRARLQVDGQGWSDLLGVHRAALEEVERIKAETSERLEAKSCERFWVTSALLCFECPPQGS